MELCNWIQVNPAELDMAEWVDPIGISEELEAQIMLEIASTFETTPQALLALGPDAPVVLQHASTGELMVVDFSQGEPGYDGRVCVVDVPQPQRDKTLPLLYIGGGLIGGIGGYMLAQRMGRAEELGAMAGAAAALAGVYFVRGRGNGMTMAGRIPKRVLFQPRGAMGFIPKRVFTAPRGPLGYAPRCGSCGPKVY